MVITGKFNLIIGCMWSGKSSELIARYNRYSLGNKKCIMVKYKFDKRYHDTNIVTHNGISVVGIACEYLYEIDHIVMDYDVVCIDEIQFYKDADIFCDKWVNSNIIVEASGLNGTSNRTPFDIISKILPQVDNITYLKAVCKKNGSDAIYSYRLSDEKGDIVIGGSDKYDAVDRTIYMETFMLNDIVLKFKKFVEIYHNNLGSTFTPEDEEKYLNEFYDNLKDIETNEYPKINFKKIIDKKLNLKYLN